MNFFYKAYSVIYLIVGWAMCRFMLLPAHSMKDVPDMLALIGAVIIIFSIIKNHNSTARMASLGYVVSLFDCFAVAEKRHRPGRRSNKYNVDSLGSKLRIAYRIWYIY